MAGAYAPMPAPDRKAAEAAEQKAAEERAARQRAMAAAQKAAAERQAAEEAAARQRAAERQAAEEAAARQRASARQAAEEAVARERAVAQQTAELAMSRRLMQASNTATAVLEADAAFNKAARSRLSPYDMPFFQEQAQIEREQYLERMMTAAGRGLLDAFTELFDADELWERLAGQEEVLRGSSSTSFEAVRTRMELAELLTHHIPETLVSLGYRPPPTAEYWTDVVENAVQVICATRPDGGRVASSADIARQELAAFKYRLRIVVEDAEQAQAAAAMDPDSRSRLPGLRAIVSAARDKAVPAALAAGTSAAIGAVAGGPAGIAIALLSGSVASIVGAVTEAGATALLAERGPQALAMSAAQLVRTDLEALDECVQLMWSQTQSTKESISFIIRRGVFQTLQDAAACSAPARDFLWEWSRVFLTLLDTDDLSAVQAHELVNSARQTMS
ncbi:MAG TPA: hypothetical protein VNW50_17640 [Streptosporangiaceae bacterium]|nr:hypothetical protein [Streptosporangiaceae bacterium]